MGPIRDIWPALVAATAGSALVLFDGTVVTVALPSIQRDLELTLAGQEWVVQAYLLAPIALLPVGGALADRLGRRRVFCAGIAVFAAASALCALAGAGNVLIAGRGLQGIGVGLTLPASLGLLAAAARRRRDRRRVVAVWTVWTAVAAAAGPVLGGAISGLLGWRWIFWLSLAGALAALAIARLRVPESRDLTVASPGWAGAPLLIAAVGAIGLALGRASTVSSVDAGVIAFAALGIIAAGVFIEVERRAAGPLIPPIMFSHPTFRVANLLTASVYGGLFAALFLLSLFLQQASRLTPLEAGLALLPFAVGLVVAAPVGERVGERRGPRAPVVLGCALAGLALLSIALGRPAIAVIVAAAGVAGFGLGAAAGPLMAAVVDTVELRRAAVATGVNSAVARVASIGAIAALGLISSIAFENRLDRERVSEDARSAIAARVFAAPQRLERNGFDASDVEAAREAADSGFKTAMGAAGGFLILSALLAAIGLGTPALNETGEMPAVVAPSPLAIALRRRVVTGRARLAGRPGTRAPPGRGD